MRSFLAFLINAQIRASIFLWESANKMSITSISRKINVKIIPCDPESSLQYNCEDHRLQCRSRLNKCVRTRHTWHVCHETFTSATKGRGSLAKTEAPPFQKQSYENLMARLQSEITHFILRMKVPGRGFWNKIGNRTPSGIPVDFWNPKVPKFWFGKFWFTYLNTHKRIVWRWRTGGSSILHVP